MAITRRDRFGRFSSRGNRVFSNGHELFGAVKSNVLGKLRKRKKAKRRRPRKRKPVRRPRKRQVGLLPHSHPRMYKSTFRFFLESVDEGHPNQYKTCYIIVVRTSVRYITAENPDGVRVLAVKYGDVRLSKARVMTVNDVSFIKADPDGYLAIRALKGASMRGTPAKGDETRQSLADKHLGRRRRRKKRQERRKKKKK